jgi:IS5 family transposase
VAHASGALRTKDLARVTVDTTVQPKNISFPSIHPVRTPKGKTSF